MFNGKAIFLLLLAIVFGAGASVFANRWLQSQTVAETDDQMTSILVAARNIEFGETVEEIDVKFANWPNESVPEGVFTSVEEVVGMVTNQKIMSGEMLHAERIVSHISGSSLSAMIAENKRAVTVRVNDVAGVAGFLLPGNRVDVLGTRMINRRAVSEMVLQNVKVLAVDQHADPEGDKPVVVRAVTLEADLDESLKLVKATTEGSVQLVLRNPEDLATRISEEPVPKVAKAPKKTVTRAPTVTIIRGTSVNDTRVRK